MAKVVNWFEIPVTDFERALKFYNQLLGAPLHVEQMGGFEMGFLHTKQVE